MQWVEESPLRTLAGYTVLTYAFSWTWWGIWASLPEASSLVGTVLFVLGGLGPFVVALAMTWRSESTVRAWLGRILRPTWSGRPVVRYYVIALALPGLVVVVAATVHVLALDGTLTPEAVPSVLEYPIFLGFVLLFAGGLEEPGWRGYLLGPIQERYAPVTAALVVGVVWAGWHLPLAFVPGTIQSQVSLPLYVAQLLALSVLLAWVTNAAIGSVLPAMVLHAGGNAVLNYYPVGGVAGATSTAGLGLLVGVVAVVAILVALVDPTLDRNRFPSASTGPSPAAAHERDDR